MAWPLSESRVWCEIVIGNGPNCRTIFLYQASNGTVQEQQLAPFSSPDPSALCHATHGTEDVRKLRLLAV